MPSGQMPWFRYYSEANSDIKVARIARQTGLSKLEVVGAWVTLLCLASESPVRGALYVTFQERYTIDDIADEFRSSTDTAKKLVDAFAGMDMLLIENGEISIANWDKRQFSSDNSTERVRKYRKSSDETPVKRFSNVSETPSEAESESDTEEEEEEDTNPKPDIDFSEFPLPETPRQAQDHPGIQMFTEITGRTPGSNQYQVVIETLQLIRERARAPDRIIIQDLKRYWLAWIGRKSKNGKAYRKDNLTWLTEWAVNGEIPSDGTSKQEAGVTKDQLKKQGYTFVGDSDG